MTRALRTLFALSLGLGLVGALDAPGARPAQAAIGGATTGVTEQLKATFEQSLVAFNLGDFDGYLHDFGPRISYNGLSVERRRLLEINKELKGSFPNLRMRYEKLRIDPRSDSEASALSVAEFTGHTANYDGSGMPATYREIGQVRALYKKAGDKWLTDTLDVAWNDSFIDIGQAFGTLGFTTLPNLLGTGQPFTFRLHAGDDERPGFGVAYAYATVPLRSVIEKAGAEKVFRSLNFRDIPSEGIVTELRAPATEGTYAHILVINKYWRAGNNESVVGQKIYTRLVRIE